jgi:hypothetical protein
MTERETTNEGTRRRVLLCHKASLFVHCVMTWIYHFKQTELFSLLPNAGEMKKLRSDLYI